MRGSNTSGTIGATSIAIGRVKVEVVISNGVGCGSISAEDPDCSIVVHSSVHNQKQERVKTNLNRNMVILFREQVELRQLQTIK